MSINILSIDLLIIVCLSSLHVLPIENEPINHLHNHISIELEILAPFLLLLALPRSLFDHYLWSIFQSSLAHYITNYISSCWTLCGQLSCTASTPVLLTCGYTSCLLYFCYLAMIPALHVFTGTRLVLHNA